MGNEVTGPFRKGQRLTADALNRALSGRVLGSGGNTARAVGKDLYLQGPGEQLHPSVYVGLRFRVITVRDNTLMVRLLENCTEAGAGLGFAEVSLELEVWKPWDLQRQSWDTGIAIDGITYTYTNVQERHSEGDASEDEWIIPAYVAGVSIVIASMVYGGAAPGGPPDRLMDENRAGRAWAKKPA